MQNVPRRSFLQVTAGAATTALVPWVKSESKSGKKYRTALIGSGWWGMNILRSALADGSVDVVALCDVDADELEVSVDEIDGMTGKAPKGYRDYRELLEKEKIEIAIVASPDHWHALQGIACLRSGAHVYMEKPTGHTVMESRAMLRVAREVNRVVQVGMHRRIGPHYQSAMKFLKEGKAGTIGMVRAFVQSPGGAEKPELNSPVPKNLDWDFYCGPAPLRPFNKRIHPGGFRNYLDFANGQLGDWGVHWLDQILWWSGQKHPKKIFSTGGRPVRGAVILNEKEQTSDAPDHQVVSYEFDGFTAVWEHRRFGGSETGKSKVGCYFHGSQGTFYLGWKDGWTFYPSDNSPVVHEEPRFDHEKDGDNIPMLWRDFIDAIQTGRRPVADIEIGHLATNMSLLGMISQKLGRSLVWDGEAERFPSDEEANALLKREYRGPWQYPA